MSASALFFHDVSAITENGLKYIAAGLVNSEHKPSPSGKDYCVSYINPFGVVCNEWRSIHEIHVYKVNQSEFDQLAHEIEVSDC